MLFISTIKWHIGHKATRHVACMTIYDMMYIITWWTHTSLYKWRLPFHCNYSLQIFDTKHHYMIVLFHLARSNWSHGTTKDWILQVNFIWFDITLINIYFFLFPHIILHCNIFPISKMFCGISHQTNKIL